jgi:VanZ family protein
LSPTPVFDKCQRGFWRAAATTFVIAAVYASLDEFHQSHISSRSGSPWDVLIDCIGAIFGRLIGSRFMRRAISKEPAAA